MTSVTKHYKTTIGLEIHAELSTKTKMFCDSKNDPDEKRPNVNVCPVCMGHPGTLPVINKEAVKHILRMGIAVGGTLADFTEFDRKNYFYPDIPKGYQISQYKYPLIVGGKIAGVELTRIHLEEDTARSSHEAGQNHDGGDHSLVDFNRAGVPLMELVTEPVIDSPELAVRFARELQLLLQYLGAGEANMEKGEMRVEANISVASEEDTKAGRFGTKVEVKNLNSFRAVERAIKYEVERHIDAYESGQKIVQETRGWDDAKQATYSQRAKEDSHDYRYFPDPDLPKLSISKISEFAKEVLSKGMPELPWTKRERYISQYEMKPVDADTFVNNPQLAAYFESVAATFSGADAGKLIKLAGNYILSDYVGLAKAAGASLEVTPTIPVGHMSELIVMIGGAKLSSRAAKDILALLYKAEGKDIGTPQQIAEREGLLQQSDPAALKKVMVAIIAANQKAVADYKAGKQAALQSLVGQGMKATKGSADPELLRTIALELLV
jgi:aspartyl-tRNA(Asn)/glutamyl-tRNA(Gln) amidotransferase subunit B